MVTTAICHASVCVCLCVSSLSVLVYTMAWKFPLTFSLVYTSALESCHTHTHSLRGDRGPSRPSVDTINCVCLAHKTIKSAYQSDDYYYKYYY